jgi:excinuclease ABC subunit A
MATGERTIELRGVRVHNLRAIDLDLPLHRLIVLCGVSGAGKTSLAFDTLCAEGQRRYVDGFSTFSRQFLEQFERPDADRIERIPPAVAIRAPHRRPSQRTTVALLADLQHPLQMLFTRLGTIVCPDCKTAVSASSAAGVRTFIESLPAGIRVQVGFAAPVPPPSKGADRSARRQWSESLRARGFGRIILAGETRTIDEALAALPTRGSSADAAKLIVVLDRLKSGAVSAERLDDSLELALAEGSGGCVVLVEETAGAAEPAAPAA